MSVIKALPHSMPVNTVSRPADLLLPTSLSVCLSVCLSDVRQPVIINLQLQQLAGLDATSFDTFSLYTSLSLSLSLYVCVCVCLGNVQLDTHSCSAMVAAVPLISVTF